MPDPQAPADRLLARPYVLRWLRRLAWGLAGLLALWGLMWAALPPLLKGVVERQAGAALGRTVSLQAVEVRPWSLSVALRGLQVRSADGQSVQLELGLLQVDAELESLLEKANAQPRSTHELREWVRQITDMQRRHPKAIDLGEAAWAASRLSQGALTLPASAAEAHMAAFAQAAECLLTPAREAHRHQRITPEELQMANDHLERQVFERLAQSPPALRGAALAQVRLQMDAPR